ncbi:MAG: hypothetical protein ACWIPJ_08490 [Polaribacter sp.]
MFQKLIGLVFDTIKEYNFLFSSGEPPQADIFLSSEVESLDRQTKADEKEKVVEAEPVAEPPKETL